MYPILDWVLTPIFWILGVQQHLVDYFRYSPTAWAAAAKFIFLLFPVLIFVSALWCTHLSLYTVPFRSRRIKFAQRMFFAWWTDPMPQERVTQVGP